MPFAKQKEAIDQRKIAVYSRKSKFTGKGESIENQVELCRERAKFAALQDGKVITEDDFLVFEDEGFSGGTLDRPSFQKMMQAVRAGQIRMIICYRLDRISRNTGDFAQLIQELEERGVAFISVRDSFDTTTPTGKAMMMMVSVFSQLERETIAERVRDNMISLAKTGRWLGGQTPTGYASRAVERITEDGKARRLYRLEQIPAEIELVKLIYQMFLDTNSFNQIETYLLQKRILTKQKKEFTRFAIKNILQNPVYMIADMQAYQYFNALTDVFADESQFNGTCGVMAYNKTKQKNGRANEYRDVTEWIIAVGKHEGVITGRDWVRVQQQIAQNSKAATEGKKKKSRSNVALLSGLLFCKHCGDYMRPKLSQRWSAEYKETIYDYLCETKEKSRRKNCDCPRANGNTLDRLVCEEVKKLSEDGSEFLLQLEAAKTQLRGQSDEQEALLASLKKELEGKEKAIAGLVNSLAETGQTSVREYIIQQIDALHEEKKVLAERIAELENLADSHCISDEDFDILKDMLSSFASSFEHMSLEQKRSALRAFVQRVDWDGETAKISFFGVEKAAMGESFFQDTPVGRGGRGGGGSIGGGKKWQFHSRVDNDFYVYHRGGVCAPLVVGHIPIKRTKLQSDALLCNMRYASPEQIPHTAERLRYFRCQRNLYQADVADHCGIDRSTYIGYEDCGRDAYPLDKLAKIAEFLQVDIVDLLDNYNRFIYEGQGQGLKAFRKSRHMTQAELGQLLQTTQSTVKRWEQGQIQMSKKKWERMNKIAGCNGTRPMV